MKSAITTLEITLSTLENNEPINRREGKEEQADIEARNAAEIRQALVVLNACEQVQQSALSAELAKAKKLAEDRLAWGNEVHRQFVQETGYTSNLRSELLAMAGNAEKERLDKEEARADLVALRESYKTITKWYDEAVQQLAGARGVIARLKVAARALLDRLAWYRSDEGAESKDDFEPLKLAQDALALTPETYQDEFLKVVAQRDRHIALFNDEQEKTASLRAEVLKLTKERDDAYKVVTDLRLGPYGGKPMPNELKAELNEMSEQAYDRASQKGNLER